MGIPKIAIGMPVFNGAKFISEAIESLLAQTFEDFVVVISDNCSTDETCAICEELIGNDSRFKIVRQRMNIGAVPNFNWVARNTSSTYFKWAAADDVLEPQYLEKCLAILETDPTIGWCHCKSDKIDESGQSWLDRLDANDPLVETVDGQRWWIGHPRPFSTSEDRVLRFSGVLMGTTWSVDSYGLIRRSVLNQTRLLDSIYGAEKVLMAELSLYGKYHRIPELLFSQRVHAMASSSIESKGKQQSFITGKKNRLMSSRLAILNAHVRSVLRSDLSPTAKAKAFWKVSCYLFQVRKWGAVAAQMLGQRGVGGGGKALMSRAVQQSVRQDLR